MKDNKIPILTKEELTKTNSNFLNETQLSFLFKRTPVKHIYRRPAKGGGEWIYVTGTYVKKALNLMFGWDWSFEVVDHKFDIGIGQAYVLGKLTVNSRGKSISKMQFGRVDIKFKKELAFNSDGTPKMAKTRDGRAYRVKEPSDKPLDLGNDLKAATTDSLKKCAAELGIASDVYAEKEYAEIKILTETKKTDKEKEDEIRLLLKIPTLRINVEDRMNAERIIDQREVGSYDKCIEFLNSAIPKITK